MSVILSIKDLWWNKQTNKGYSHCAGFMNRVRKAPADVRARFFLPNPVAAPWHVQARANNHVYNIWPHKAKWQKDNDKAKYGWDALFKAIKADVAKEKENADG